MILSRLILGLLAVGFAAAKKDLIVKANLRDHKSVSTKTYRHASGILHDEMLGGYFTVLSKKRWAVAEISNKGVTSLWDSVVPMVTAGHVEKSVHFLTYFQAPLALNETDPNANIEVFLYFTYHLEVEFKWDSEITAARSHFEWVGSYRNSESRNYTHWREVYKVTCRPGSLFPIRLTVFNVKKSKTFHMKWSLSLDPKSQQYMKPQLVKLLGAKDKQPTSRDFKGIPPLQELTDRTFTHVPLTPSLSKEIIMRNAIGKGPAGNYRLEGYIRPLQERNRFVLSALTVASVHIFLASLPTDKNFTVLNLQARYGIATEGEAELNLNKLYKVSVEGIMDGRNTSDFTLRVSAPGAEMNSTDVILLIPESITDDSVEQQKVKAGADELENSVPGNSNPLAEELPATLEPGTSAMNQYHEEFNLDGFEKGLAQLMTDDMDLESAQA